MVRRQRFRRTPAIREGIDRSEILVAVQSQILELFESNRSNFFGDVTV